MFTPYTKTTKYHLFGSYSLVYDDTYYLIKVKDFVALIQKINELINKSEKKDQCFLYKVFSQFTIKYNFKKFMENESPKESNFGTCIGLRGMFVGEVYGESMLSVCCMPFEHYISIDKITDQCVIGLSEKQLNFLTEVHENSLIG